jgi:predicted Zn-dependent protease
MDPHERSIMAAQGYLELGMFRDVWREIQELPAALRDTAEVLELSTLSLMGERRWDEALERARRLREKRPVEPSGFIHEAYCLHELGRTREALETLLNGPPSLREKPVYFYNAACYRARLGELEGAVKLLGLAFKMDGSLRRSAKHDPDLAALKDKL